MGIIFVYQLFADDTALFLLAFEESFQAAREAIAIYERISGDRLNLDKSTIVPMHDGDVPDWFSWTGYKVA